MKKSNQTELFGSIYLDEKVFHFLQKETREKIEKLLNDTLKSDNQESLKIVIESVNHLVDMLIFFNISSEEINVKESNNKEITEEDKRNIERIKNILSKFNSQQAENWIEQKIAIFCSYLKNNELYEVKISYSNGNSDNNNEVTINRNLLRYFSSLDDSFFVLRKDLFIDHFDIIKAFILSWQPKLFHLLEDQGIENNFFIKGKEILWVDSFTLFVEETYDNGKLNIFKLLKSNKKDRMSFVLKFGFFQLKEYLTSIKTW